MGKHRDSYVYFATEDDSKEFVDCVKIGWSVDPLKRIGGYQAGNPRRIAIIFTLLGGEPLEAEFHRRFSPDKIGDGGEEWFRVTPELLDFVQEKIRQQLTVSLRELNKIGELISIPTVGLAEASRRKVVSITPASTVQQHGVAETHSPINPYAKACGRKDD